VKAHPFIGAEKAAGHGIARACRLLKVSRAAYYQRLRGVPCARRTADVILSAKITSLYTESKGTYGSPRVHQMLRRDGSCGKRRVARLMRAAGLEGRRKKRWRTTTIADPAAERARDLIQRDFAPRPPPGLPQARHLPVPAPENGNSASEPPAPRAAAPFRPRRACIRRQASAPVVDEHGKDERVGRGGSARAAYLRHHSR
jgi:transposase InsO family protein